MFSRMLRLDVNNAHPVQLKENAEDILKVIQKTISDEFYTKWKWDKNLQDFQWQQVRWHVW